MKAHIPIIIAFIILSALLVSTTYYVTTRTTHVSESLYGYTLNEWVLIYSDLETLCLLALSNSSYTAAEVFSNTFYTTYDEVYGDYYASLNNFIQALDTASREASKIIDDTIDYLLDNWANYKRRDGYIVNIVESTGYYRVAISTVNDVSIGKGVVGVHIVIDMVSPYGEHRVFNRTIEAVYIMKFRSADFGDDGLYLPINVTAYVNIDGNKFYYLVPKEDLYISVHSETFEYLGSLQNVVDYTINSRAISTFYYGGGVSYTIYKLPYRSLLLFAKDIAVNHTEMQTGTSDDGDPIGLHLWTTISSINIDNIIVYSALKIAFKFEIERYNGPCDWSIIVGVEADETFW